MPLNREEFVRAYPTLFHVSLARDVEQVKRHGLLSTSALLDLCGIEDKSRFSIESRQRPRAVILNHSVLGNFIINDQAPMNAVSLSNCLMDLSVEQWCRSLNRRVFFWPTRGRLAKHVGAKLAAGRQRIVFSFEARSLFDVLDFDSFEFSAINSGNTMRKAALRGSMTFLKAEEYPFHERRKTRGLGAAIAEVTYPYAITSTQFAAISATSEVVRG